MKLFIRLLVIAVALMLVSKVRGQIRPELRSVIDSVVAKAKCFSLNAHTVKWDSIQSEMYKSAKGAKTVKDLRTGFEILLLALKDKHGKFIDPVSKISLASHPDHGSQNQETLISSATNSNVEFRILDDEIRYIKIAGIPGTDLQKEAAMIRSAIDSLGKSDSLQWIVDLRYSAGDHMNTLMAGMGPLLGEGMTGALVDGKSRIKKLYEIHNGKFYDDQHLIAGFPCSKELETSRIAVLTSRYTDGAGEFVSMAMKGRKNTKLFGESTAGNITVTRTIEISKNLIMTLSEASFQDRRGRVYTNFVKPDILVAFDPSEDIAHDKAILAAIEWLKDSVHQDQAMTRLSH